MTQGHNRRARIAATLLMLLLGASARLAHADGANEPIPSFYQEPGISRTREYVNQHAAEHIDPFTGKLQWHLVDLVIPGNGGLDIKVQRSYNSLNDDAPSAPEITAAGLGWTLHFGRVLRRASVGICALGDPKSRTNPVLELPDGSRRVLYDALDNVSFVSSDFWRAECAQPPAAGLNVRAPDGTTYALTTIGGQIGSPGSPINTFYVTRITDRNGNWLNFSYTHGVSGVTAVSSITASDGRAVTFNYAPLNGLDTVLTSVVEGTAQAPQRTWTYTQSAPPGTFGMTQLSQVTRPDGRSWVYDYNTGSGSSAGYYSLRRVTYPEGGVIDYTYAYAQLGASAAIPRSTVIAQKLASPGGAWNWTYTPAVRAFVPDGQGNISWSIPPSATEGELMDKTQVVGPDESKTYYHMGYNSAAPGFVYLVGSLLGAASPLQSEVYGYAPILISNQDNASPSDLLIYDASTSARLIASHGLYRAGESYQTSFGNFDAFGHPRSIVETGTATRSTSLTYLNDTARWILGVKKDETVTEGAESLATTRTFDANANLLTETRAGVTTTTTYTAEGDVATRKDARDNITTYSDYFRGIARREDQPGGVTVTRTVSPAGNILSETDGENATTQYTYDGLNRVTSIQKPLGNLITVDWDDPATSGLDNIRLVRRGAFEERTQYDGFGRTVGVTRNSGVQVVTQTYEVDSLGRRTFASYPNASIGTGYTYDMLNRPVYVFNEYNPSTGALVSFRRRQYGGYKEYLTDERNYTTAWRYRAYGNPDKRELMAITDAQSGTESTTIGRNIAGQMTSVTQDGVSRSYGYDARLYLTSVTEPETGLTLMGRDAVGNMTTRQVGSSGVTSYAYDERNRLTTVSYPAGTPGVTKVYYNDDRLRSVAHGISRREYQYDANKNLLSETLSVNSPLSGSRSFVIGYGYNGNDALQSLTYGSGRVLDFDPDGFGWPRKVGSYVVNIAYHATGQPSSYTYGNGLTTLVGLNNRQLPQTLSVSGNLLDLSYGYDQAGNITSIGSAGFAAYNRTMDYDALDRLTSATGPWGAGLISYDLRGNITSQQFGGETLNYTYQSGTQRLSGTSGARNSTLSYDAYGNVTSNGTTSFTYDDAARMRCARCGQADEILFDHDGTGIRVRQQKSGGETFFVYSRGGQLLWEETPNVQLKEYIYFQGKAVATRPQALP